MTEQWTPAQKQAVFNRGGTLLVSAAAGSGKTKVLVDRLLHYLTDEVNPANIDEFLIITYTRAAASELRAKIAAKLTEAIAQDPENRHLQKQLQRLYLTQISTVHGFCGDLLKQYAYQLDLDADFRVAEENTATELREQVLSQLLDNAYEELCQDPDFLAFAETQGLGRNDAQLPELIQKVYDSARCHPDPEKWLNDCLAAVESPAEDVGQTPWGHELMEQLFSWLDGQIPVMEHCAQIAAQADTPKVATLYQQNADALKHLRASQSWDEVCQRIHVQFGRFPTGKQTDTGRNEELKAVRDACKDALKKKEKLFGRDSASHLRDFALCAQAQRGLILLVRRFGKEYTLQKKKRRILDFSDLEHRALDLLLGKDRTSPTATAREVGRRYREVMVDEYQDSNAVQDAIFSSLTDERHNCFLVGDVKQSIYQFRLADPSIFLKKYNTFPMAQNAVDSQGRKVLLSHNFRSGGEIMEAVNHVFSCCMSKRVGDVDYTQAEALRQWEGCIKENLPDPAVEFYAIDASEETSREEADFVAGRIAQMLRQGSLIRDKDGLRPVTAGDIVILLRAPGSVGNDYRKALEERGIRCASNSGEDLLRTPEISTLRSILQTVSNPRQDIPLLSALASPAFGFTAEDLALVRGKNRKCCVYDALLQSPLPKAQAFVQTLNTLRTFARRSTLTELLEHIYLMTDLDGVYAAQPEGTLAKENLRAFFQLAASYEKGNLCTLEQFLEYLTAQEQKGLLSGSGGDSGAVTIMSIHTSKGLEFPVVFLAGLARKFNTENLRQQVLCHKELGLGLCMADSTTRVRYPTLARLAISEKLSQEAISEELRVLYVAMTRAKDRLIMTYTARKLEDQVRTWASRLALDKLENLSQAVNAPGQWVLLAALTRTDAGALRVLADATIEGTVSDCTWKICHISETPETPSLSVSRDAPVLTLPEGALQLLAERQAFQYPHMAATVAPSKQTATGIKGREKDMEAAQDAPEAPRHQWRKASFLTAKTSGIRYGNTMHKAMQYLHFDACGDLASVREEIRRLRQDGILSPEEADMVDAPAIAKFFASDLGWQLRMGGQILREFKFSILDRGEKYAPGLEGEQVLLQGVVDCALIQPDGITVLDFKTDRITPEEISATTEKYRPQVETYREAMERIFEKKVTHTYLYFFHLGELVSL